MFYGVNNSNLQMIKSLLPKLRINARGDVIRVLGDEEEMCTFEENIELMAEIKSVLTSEGATVSEIQTKSETLRNLSNQKISALLKKMCDAGSAVKTVDKKKSYFSLAE